MDTALLDCAQELTIEIGKVALRMLRCIATPDQSRSGESFAKPIRNSVRNVRPRACQSAFAVLTEHVRVSS
jgi:hypothetical protein